MLHSAETSSQRKRKPTAISLPVGCFTKNYKVKFSNTIKSSENILCIYDKLNITLLSLQYYPWEQGILQVPNPCYYKVLFYFRLSCIFHDKAPFPGVYYSDIKICWGLKHGM